MKQVPVSLHGGHTTVLDGTASAAEMVAAAAGRGMEVYGLSEHFYRPREERFLYDEGDRARDWGREGWPRFAEEVAELKASSSGPRVLLGAEVEYIPGYREWTLSELDKWPLDYVVISVHFVFDGHRAHPFDVSEGLWRSAAEALGGPVGLYCAYYDNVLAALEWQVGHVVGHLDVIKVFDPAPVADPAIDERVDRILARCAQLGVLLDLNAKGLIKPCREVYPSPAILARAHEAGVDVVPGDDAHSPEQVGNNLDVAVERARRAGYERIALPAHLGGTTWKI